MRPHRKHFAKLLAEQFGPSSRTLVGAEIGVQRGHMSAILLREVPKIRQLILVDRWIPPHPQSAYAATSDASAQADQARHTQNMLDCLGRVAPYRDRCRIIRAQSHIAASHVADESLHFVFIDDDHSRDGCTVSLHAWWPKVRPGGVFAGHDYSATKQESKGYGVKSAVDAFAELMGFEVEIHQFDIWATLKK